MSFTSIELSVVLDIYICICYSCFVKGDKIPCSGLNHYCILHFNDVLPHFSLALCVCVYVHLVHLVVRKQITEVGLDVR